MIRIFKKAHVANQIRKKRWRILWTLAEYLKTTENQDWCQNLICVLEQSVFRGLGYNQEFPS